MISLNMKYDVGYKRFVCRMVLEKKQNVRDVAIELGRSCSTIYKWIADYKNQEDWQDERVKQQEKDEEINLKMNSNYLKELKQLKIENHQLKKENSNLKKALHLLTGN